MKKLYVILLWLLFVPLMASAQQYKLSEATSKNYTTYTNKLENVVNNEGKYYWSNWVKMIMGKIWIYLKNWEKALKNRNYDLAIKNYQTAIDELKNIRWTKDIINHIEKIIKEIEKEANKQPNTNRRYENKVKNLKPQLRRL